MSAINIKTKVTAVHYTIYEVNIKGRICEIKFTKHSQERIKVWHLTDKEVIDGLFFCEEVVTGHHNRFIAHKIKGDSVIRIIYEYEERIPKIITVYVPKKERYFQGGGKYADKIFSK